MRSIHHRPRIINIGICIGIALLLLLVLMASWDRTHRAALWAKQLQVAQTRARLIDPRAALSGISILSLDTEDPLALGSVEVIVSFKTSPTEGFELIYESGAPDWTIERWSTSRGELPPVLTATMLAAVQRSPADVIAATWDAGRRYQRDRGVTDGYQNVLVYLVTDPARMPEAVTTTAVYEVIYQAYDRPSRTIFQRSFWVDTTTGTVVAQTDATL
jgi:hypothetical protein